LSNQSWWETLRSAEVSNGAAVDELSTWPVAARGL